MFSRILRFTALRSTPHYARFFSPGNIHHSHLIQNSIKDNPLKIETIGIKSEKLHHQQDMRLDDTTQKLKLLTLNDGWQEIYLEARKSIKIVQEHFDIFPDHNIYNLLNCVDEVRKAKDISLKIQKILEDDSHRRHYPFCGPLSDSLHTWANAVRELHSQNKFKGLHLMYPETELEIAISNLLEVTH